MSFARMHRTKPIVCRAAFEARGLGVYQTGVAPSED
jgi:hypothetical protein